MNVSFDIKAIRERWGILNISVYFVVIIILELLCITFLGLWYPTSCVVYNPPELGMYSNYMMPLDTCYYYYTVPEVPQIQEYVPGPYQVYTTPLPKGKALEIIKVKF